MPVSSLARAFEDGRYELSYNIARGKHSDPKKAPDFVTGKPRATFKDFKAILTAARALDGIERRK